jgi:hypothetical protein
MQFCHKLEPILFEHYEIIIKSASFNIVCFERQCAIESEI